LLADPSPPEVNAGSTRKGLRLLVLVGFIVVASALSSPGEVLRAIEDLLADPFRFALALVVLYLLRPLVAWPLSLVSVLVGYAYGFAVGVPVALVGTVGSCLVPFVLARYFRSDVGLLGWLSGSGRRFFEATGPVRGVFAARLSPAPADAISYGAGLSGVSASGFVLGTLLGEIPWTAAFVLVGASMTDFGVGEATLDSAAFVIGTAILASLALAGPAYRHLRARSSGAPVADGGTDDPSRGEE
jgi:uncharacterized membrane protein YdjX (TVP38/TMEM64 family)